jgi:MFS family permease
MALLAMRFVPKEITTIAGNHFQKIIDGFAYTFSSPPIRSILLLSGLVSLMGMQYAVLVPVFADKILKGDAQTLGFLMAASGVGAIFGGVYLATRRSVIGLGKFVVISPSILGIGLIIFALSRFLPLSLFAMLLIGLGTILQISAGNIILQTIVDDDKRGRVMSLYTMSFLGMTPFGNLLGGILGDRIGVTDTLIIAGIVCILGSIYFSRQLPELKKIVYKIYERKGIITS